MTDYIFPNRLESLEMLCALSSPVTDATDVGLNVFIRMIVKFTCPKVLGCCLYIFFLFGVLRRFQHCTGHITMGSWKGRGNQYIEFARVLYCKLPTNGKQLPAFPLTAMTGIEPQPHVVYKQLSMKSVALWAVLSSGHHLSLLSWLYDLACWNLV